MRFRWLLVDYGGVLAHSHMEPAEREMASFLSCERAALQAEISERSDLGQRIRLDQLSEADFWRGVARKLGGELSASPHQLTRLWAASYELNEAINGTLRLAAAKGLRLGVATNVDRYREQYLRSAIAHLEPAPCIFASWRIGALKPREEFYRRVTSMLDLVGREAEILYFDDRLSHTAVASAVGWTSHQYIDARSFATEVGEAIG